MSDEDFVPFVFKNFPPKHKENPKMPAVSQTFEKIKKAYIKLTTYYHPDHIDIDVHGEKYKVLCEEVAKRISARYTKMKNES